MKRNNISEVFLLLVFILFFCCSSGEKVKKAEDTVTGIELKYSFRKGDKFTITSTLETIEGVEAQGMSNETTTSMNFEFGFEVRSVEDNGNINLEMQFQNMELNMTSPMGNYAADLSPLAGKKIRFTITPSGEASNFEGIENLPEVLFNPAKPTTKDDYINNLKGTFLRLAENKVQIGEYWDVKTEVTTPITVKANTKYQIIEEIEKDGLKCYKIEGKTKSDMNGKIENPQAGTMYLEALGDGDQTIYFSKEKNIFIDMESSGLVSGTLEVMGSKLPYSVKTKSKTIVKF